MDTGGEGQKRGEQQYAIDCIRTLLPRLRPPVHHRCRVFGLLRLCACLRLITLVLHRSTIDSERTQAVMGRGEGGCSTQLNTSTLCPPPPPPACVPPPLGARYEAPVDPRTATPQAAIGRLIRRSIVSKAPLGHTSPSAPTPPCRSSLIAVLFSTPLSLRPNRVSFNAFLRSRLPSDGTLALHRDRGTICVPKTPMSDDIKETAVW